MKRILASILFLNAALILSSCSFPKHKVRYEVTCTKCEISYIKEKDENILREPHTDAWSYEFLAYEGQRLSLAAANQDTLSDTVKVSIFLNDSEVKTLSKGGKKWSAASVTYTVE